MTAKATAASLQESLGRILDGSSIVPEAELKRAGGNNVRVCHVVDLLDEAYRQDAEGQ